MRNSQILFLIVFLFTLACEEKKENVIDFSDVHEESVNYKENDTAEDTSIETEDSTKEVLNFFVSNGVEAESVLFIEKRLFPERFSPLKTMKIEINRKSDTVQFLNLTFNDSTHTMNAFFNWIDNFGEKGISVRVGERIKMQNKPFLVLVGDTNLIFIESRTNLNDKEWLGYFENIGFEHWSYLLTQRKYSKVEWFEFEEGEFLEFERN